MLKNSKQKAAMFGLDARIALAIFGALSIISGAVMYKVINNVRTQQALTSMQELVKALEAYYLDTGTLPLATPDNLAIGELMSNTYNRPGWKGPYISDYIYGLTMIQKNDFCGYGISFITSFTHQDISWSLPTPPEKCTAGGDCSVYIGLIFAIIPDLGPKLDDAIDNSDGPTQGKIRYQGNYLYMYAFPYRI